MGCSHECHGKCWFVLFGRKLDSSLREPIRSVGLSLELLAGTSMDVEGEKGSEALLDALQQIGF